MPLTSKNSKLKPTLKPIDSPSTSIAHRHIDEPWHNITATEKLPEYNAEKDPYCPFTHTSKFKEKMKLRVKLENSQSKSLLSKSMTLGPIEGLDPQLRTMERPISAPEREKNPKHQVSVTSLKSGGLTYSTEPSGSAIEGQAELEVLKAILNREGYLGRLENAAKKVGRKFKPEVADILDFVRAASIDVVEAVVKWREAKNDHSAAFFWNGVNYLLKMSSDLDYLAEYRAIRKWLGFSIVRNPFCVPFPLEEGAVIFSESISDPKHMTDIQTQTLDGFIIGGMAPQKLKTKYSKSEDTARMSPYKATYVSDNMSATSASAMSQSSGPAKFSETISSGISVAGDQTKSFILNEDMSKLRQAELVILREEKKFGRMLRDPYGRITSELLAQTKQIDLELRKDNLKSIVDKSSTSTKYAPHAVLGGIGLEDEPDAPQDRTALAVSTSERENKDPDIPGIVHGKDKIGGAISAIEPRGLPSRIRQPLMTTPANKLEFVKQRKKQTIGERLAEITRLRDQVRQERLALEDLRFNSTTSSEKPSRKISTMSSSREINQLTSPTSAAAVAAIPERSTGSNYNLLSNDKSPGPPPPSMRQWSQSSKSDLLKHQRSGKLDSSDIGGSIQRQRSSDIGGSIQRQRSSDIGGSIQRQRSSDIGGSIQRQRSSDIGGSIQRQKSSDIGGGIVRQRSSKFDLHKQKSSRFELMRQRSSDSEFDETYDTANPSDVREGGHPSLATIQRQKSKTTMKRRQSTAKRGGQVAVAATPLPTEFDEDVLKLEAELKLLTKDTAKTSELKQAQRNYNNSLHAKEIERKRRLLPKPGKKKGAIPDDPYNVYDFYAIRIQAAVRGWLSRNWVRWYVNAVIAASKIIQAGARGYLAREKSREMFKRTSAATRIQAAFRGWRARVMMAKLMGEHLLGRAATQIQRMWRGILGVKRAMSKQLLDKAAQDALLAVDSRTLFAPDVKELARRIQLAIEEPQTTTFPPDEVLHLLRLVTMIMEAGKEHTGLTSLSRIGARYFATIEGETLTWEQAMMLVNRSNRFVRLVRALAFAPCARPPRLIKVPMEAQTLYSAQKHNPRWCVETFETMGKGSKCCTQVFKWVSSMVDVAIRQEQFLGFIANVFRDWLPQLMDLQKLSRRHEFDVALLERKVSMIEDLSKLVKDDPALLNMMTAEIRSSSATLQEAKDLLVQSHVDEETMRSDQTSKETHAMVMMEQKVNDSEKVVGQLATAFQNLLTAAEKGDLRAEDQLAEARANLIMERVVVKELQVNLKLLEVQCGMNRALRTETGRLPQEPRHKARTLGEVQALITVIHLKMRLLLRIAGARDEDELDEDLREKYIDLREEAEQKENTYKYLLKAADSEMESFNSTIAKEMTTRQTQTDLERFVPSEEEMEEERYEDDQEAKQERSKKRQFVPDHVLLECQKRVRPLVIAFSRDLPGHLKSKIHSEITKSMSGLFVTLDVTENLGFDLKIMQEILDAHKSILLSVDHGLTKVTRDDFIRTFNMIIQSLIPKPVVIFAMGDESNMRIPAGESYYGVSIRDMAAMRDRPIKIGLESLAYLLKELRRPDISHRMEMIANRLTAPTLSYIVVLEAIYIIQADHDNFRLPENHIAAVSWHMTQGLLHHPQDLVDRLQSICRGKANDHICLCISEYIHHRNWPATTKEERKSDPLLQLLATYVETWVKCEIDTLNKGGIPDKVFFKNGIKGLQTVVTVADAVESDDVIVASRRGGWRVPAAQMIRSCLQDMRVLKVVQKIDGEMYNINIYRDADTIYFDTYEPSSSQLYMISIAVSQVPDLLTPNTFSLSKGLNKDPPQTAQEMYMRLAKLLRFEKATKQRGGRKELVCHREYTMLKRLTRNIDGHTCLLTCFEAALGEIFFMAYLPEFSCRITLLVDDELRLKLRDNYDSIYEKELRDTDDAMTMLPFIIDRLRILPFRSAMMSNIFSSGSGSKAVIAKNHHQGFSIKVRCKGGPGMKRKCIPIRFAGVVHIVTIRTLSVSNLLRVFSYEPRTQKMLVLDITAIQRKALFGSIGDDVLQWLPQLVKRLHLDWRGDHSLVLNCTLYRSVRKLHGRRMIFTVSVVDEAVLKVSALDPVISFTFSTLLSKNDVIRLINYESTSDTKEKGVASSVRHMLRRMVAAQDMTKNTELDPAIFDMTMEDILKDKQNIAALVRQLEILLERTDKTNIQMGYYCKLPVHVKMFPERNEDVLKPFDTVLRFSHQLHRTISNGSPEDVQRTRRQAKPVIMEEELNLLAVRKEEEAKIRSDLLKVTTEKLGKVLEENESLLLLISKTAADTTSSLVTQIEVDHLNQHDMEKMKQKKNILPMITANGKEMVEVDLDELPEDQREIAIRGDKVVFERGVKVNFRENKARWHGHVSVKVLEGSCWGGVEGVMRKLKFSVFEPGTASYYYGDIRNARHLREILGTHGQDLLDRSKSTEMLLFIAAQRLELVRNLTTWDGEPIGPGEPAYRVEFVMDRLFSVDKVTPVNVGGDLEEYLNRMKLIDNERTRGRKILRMARRISGLLMHIQVFEIPKAASGGGGGGGGSKLMSSTSGTTASVEKGNGLGLGRDSSLSLSMVSEKEDASESSMRMKPRTKLEKREAPTFRIVSYDPRSRQKTVLIVDPGATTEIAGGSYSPYLEEGRRRELARLVCESLVLNFPRGKPFELVVPWSGAKKESLGAMVAEKNTWRSSADRTIKRTGKLFRAGVRISNLELIVTVFSNVTPKMDNDTTNNTLDIKRAATSSSTETIVMNFYHTLASETCEFLVDEKEQLERVKKLITEYPPGVARATAIRTLCRFCRADLNDDPDDPNKRILRVELVPINKDFIDDYNHVAVPKPGENLRPVGAPLVFLPLDTCGELLVRRGVQVPAVGRHGVGISKGYEYVISVYSKSPVDGPEKGLVVRMYNRLAAKTLILHVGPSEIIRLCQEAEEPELLRDMYAARLILKDERQDFLEKDFVTITERGELMERARKLVEQVVDIVCKDLGIRLDALGEEYPCLRSAASLPT